MVSEEARRISARKLKGGEKRPFGRVKKKGEQNYPYKPGYTVGGSQAALQTE